MLTDISDTDISTQDMRTALTPAVFHVLLALAAGERHGYGVMKDVLVQSDGDVKLGPGTLYGTLQRLIECEWVVEAPRAGPRMVAGRTRRYYRITTKGRSALNGDVARLEGLVRVVRSLKESPRGSRS
jgi:DNA-binding PadR family transcriptional regulator